jgi:hypothetical protein
MKDRILSIQILFLLLLSGCGGVETFYFYRNQETVSPWRPYTGTRFETETGSATAFQLIASEYGVLVQLHGNWSGWDMIGPLFIPIIPSKSPGEFIDVTYQVTSDARNKLVVEGIYLLLNNDDRLMPLSQPVKDDRDSAGKGRFRFKKPSYRPNYVTVVFGETRINGRPVSLPDLKLVLHTEKCYWTGDTYQSYVNCAVRSQ